MIENLKIISSDEIVQFESSSDERTEKLREEISRDGRLKNPLLVYPLKDKYLLLDDASILAALKSLDVSHIPVQLAKPGLLTVHSWQRMVEKWYQENLVSFCARFPRQVRLLKSTTGPLASHQAEIRFRNNTIMRVSFLSKSFLVRVDMSTKFIRLLMRAHKSYRTKIDFHNRNPFRGFGNASAAVFPPMFSLVELAKISAHDILLPHGLARVDQPGRVLGIDYALAILKDNVSAEEKESFLRHLIHMRMSSDRVAYYDGSVFMFNN